MNLTFDTETTGIIDYKQQFNVHVQPHIVQIGALLTDDDEKVKAEINVLIKPDNWTIPTEATAIHGITTEDCVKYGVDIKHALAMVNLFLKLRPNLIAHNLDFDFAMFKYECMRLDKPNILDGLNKICTMKSSTNLVKIPSSRGFKWPKLQETHKFLFGEEFANAHDAMADVRACSRCYFELKRRNALPQS